jgi:3-phosphoshikimate 1-carboxyvinyltransferase
LSKKTIHPAKVVTGGVAPPGDKSISHRYAMLAGMAEGPSELSNFALAADCHSTLGCMKSLGADVKVENTLVRVTGRGTARIEEQLARASTPETRVLPSVFYRAFWPARIHY